jgi:hypothetical protein
MKRFAVPVTGNVYRILNTLRNGNPVRGSTPGVPSQRALPDERRVQAVVTSGPIELRQEERRREGTELHFGDNQR